MDAYKATVVAREVYGKNVTLFFKTNMPNYESGQYITIVFEDTEIPEGKSYSLSSAPFEDVHSITIKPIGEYSDRLCDMQPGDEFLHTEAYGYFNIKTDRPLVCLAAGVGISPIWSVIKQTRHDSEREITLAYSGSSLSSMPFVDDIKNFNELNVSFHVTQEDSPYRSDRISAKDYIKGGAVYLICGPVEFTRDMWEQLVNLGISEIDISTEVFFE
ncbi:FAD-dependent oxidoreductase [Candidatus Saccharibacteria bacterium]|jgi:ferredoxin-NADP reductase|nr:FAD-dependent oxidoreductase [Candidatus Saccharibacteria bacterium]